MSRIELINKLKGLEERKNILENIYLDISNEYSGDIHLKVDIGGTIYNRKHKGEVVQVGEYLFKEFLNEEISRLENLIKGHLEGLK